MAKKVVGREMTSRVGLDSAEAVKSLKQLTAEVKANTSGWKAQETALKSAGEYQKAAAARVDGLAKSMEMQKAKIDELKSRQAGLNRDTKDGEQQYLKLTDQINKASRSYDSMGGQLDRAKSKLQYYNSGLADLQKGYKQTTALSESYVKRLEAEGKSAEANKARLGGLKQAYSNMEAQYKAQTSELERIKNASGATSDAYKRQQVRVNETAAAMAKQKSEVTKLTVKYGTMSDKMAKLSDKATGTKDKLKTLAGGFKTLVTAASASIAGVTAASVAGAEKASTLQNIYKQNQNLLTTSGESAKSAIKSVTEMQKDGQKYSVKYGVSQKEIAEQYQDLIKRGHTAKEALAVMRTELQASVASGDEFSDVTKVSSQVIEAFGMKTNNTAKMVKNTKRVVNDLAYAADTTATDFSSLGKGMEYVGDSANNAGFSVEQTSAALGELSNHGLEADKAGTGLRKMITSLASPSAAATGALKKIGITSTKAFQDSKGNFKSMSDIMEIMEKHTKNLGGAQKAAIFKAVFGATGMQAAQILAKNNKQLSSLTDEVTKAGKAGEYVQKLANKNSGTAQMNIRRFKESGEALETMMGAKLLPVMTEAANKMTVAFNNKGVQNGLKNVTGLIAKLLEGTLKVVEFMGNHTKTVAGFGIALGSVWAIAKVSKFIGMLREMKTNFGLVGDAVKSATGEQGLFNIALDANPIGITVVALGALTAGIVLAYKHIKPFRQWVNKAFKSVVNFGKGIAKWGSNIGKSVGKALGNMSKKWKGFKKSFAKAWKKHWSVMGKSLRNSWNGSVKNTKKFFHNIAKIFSSFGKSFKKAWHSYWNFVHDFYAGIFKKIVKVFKSWTSAIAKTWNRFKKWFGKKWNNMWNGVHDFFHGITKKLSKTFSGWTSGAMNILGSFGDKFKSGWHGLVKGVKDIFGGLWKDLKGFAKDGMNNVIDIINHGIDAVDSVIHAFGGKKKTIADLGHVNFATGTGMFSGSRNPITKPTMAMLNDGNDSPQTGNKEMIMLPNGDSGIVQGRNTKMLLPAGTEVLNASETAMLMSMQGVTKYAKGTGFFGDILNSVTSGISGVASWVGKKVGSLEKFFKTATNIIAHPIKSLENLFSWSSKGVSGVMSNIGHGLFDGAEKQAKTWWKTLWSMVDLNGGGITGGVAHTPGAGWKVTSGFGNRGGVSGGYSSHDGVDFSGARLVHAMLPGIVSGYGGAPSGWGGSNGIGEYIATHGPYNAIYQELNGKSSSGAKILVKKGETVKAGDPIAKLGPNASHVHVGVTKHPMFSIGGSGTAGWLDVTKLKSAGKSDKKSKGSNSTIRKQVGGGFWKFISKIASMFGDDGGGSGTGDPGGAGVQRWKSDVKSALSKLGLSTSASMVSRVLRQINTESSGNPKAMGGTDGLADGHAEGLMQVKPGTFRAYHLSGHNNIWNGYDNMLAGLNYAKHRYGSGLSFLGNGHGYEYGGIINTNQLIEVAEHNKPEMVLPLTNKSRANQLITQANQIINGSNDSQVASIDSDSNKKLDKLISLMSAILGNMGNVQAVIAKSDVVNAVKSDNKTASQYSQMMGY
ncbi:phage tail tape measure protein [Pediococcus pentosaceus]|uniref:phage tail tape measure protein n=1 Tax=Pediococcus pentosaceus TaxID=1255 RepID=UPI0040366BEA